MFVLAIKNILELLKFYMIGVWLFQVTGQKNKKMYIAVVIIFFFRMLYLGFRDDNMAAYLVFMICEMQIIYVMKFWKNILMTVWLAFIVGSLDEISEILMNILFQGNLEGYREILLHMMTVAIIIIMTFINRKTRLQKQIRFKGLELGLVGGFTVVYSVICAYILHWGGTNVRTGIYIILVFLFMYIQIGMVIRLVEMREYYHQKADQNQDYLNTQKRYYKQQDRKNHDVREFRHDVKEHLFVMEQLASQKKWEDLQKYFNRIENKLHINNKTYIVSNRIAEAIIEKYIDIAKAKGIDFQVEGCFPEIDEIETYDICTIFDNLIKNAIEAAEKTVGKHMELNIHCTDMEIFILMRNDCLQTEGQGNRLWNTTKADKVNHGFGLKNIRESVDKYQGTVRMKLEDGKMETRIVLYRD